MKVPILLIVLGLVSPGIRAADEAGDAVAAIGLLPSQRTGQHVTAQERNPFAAKPKDVAKVTQQEDTETQESKIRALFRTVTVTGVRRDRNGSLIGLASDLILRQGERVSPVIEEQTEVLVVSKVEPKQIELTFVEDKDSTQPRTIILPVRNKVEVRQKLFAQAKGERKFFVANTRKAVTAGEAAGFAASLPSVGSSAGVSTKWPGLESPAAAESGEPAKAVTMAPPVSFPVVEPAFPAEVVGPPAPPSGDAAGDGAPSKFTAPAPAATAEGADAPAAPPSGGSTPAPSTEGAVPSSAPAVSPAPVPLPPRPATVPVPHPAAAKPADAAPPAAPQPSPDLVSPPTYLRRHRDRSAAEPETSKPATPAPPPGGVGVVE